MAIIRNLASMMLKGKIGDTTYYVSQSRQLARQALNNSNYGETASRTDVQQNRRVRWANLVNFYSGNKAWMKKAYEGLKPGVSIFNRFIQLNINAAQVALTKSEAQAKIWIPASYRVSQGSLAPITDTANGTTSLVFTESADATIGEISKDLIANNPALQNGDAIVCVRFFGTKVAPGSAAGIVPATYAYSEFVLDVNSEVENNSQQWADAVGKFSFADAGSADAVVFIHTRKSGGKLYVSTEDMVVTSSIVTATQGWRSDAQFAKAIASYGESTMVPLAPGGNSSQQSGNDSSSGGGGIEDEPGGEGSLE